MNNCLLCNQDLSFFTHLEFCNDCANSFLSNYLFVKEKKHEKKVVIFSGGMDSITLLNFLHKYSKDSIYGLSFDYGQKHSVELDYAKYWGKKLCKEHKIIDLSFMKEIANTSALLNDTKIPKTHYTDESQKQTVVPNRNAVMLSIATAWAENLKIKDIFYGAHATDYTIYPDCRPSFLKAISKAMEEGTYNKINIHAPFIKISKTNILGLGLYLGVEYDKTWTCYEPQKSKIGDYRACGKCGTCQERLESFAHWNKKDPAKYI